VAYVLATNFGSLDALLEATPEQLSATHEIGEVIAQSVYDFFQSKPGKHTVREFKEIGLAPKMEKPAGAAADANLPFAGMTIVVTGTLEKYKREEIEAMIVKFGGRASGSVSKKTSFLIAGKDAGSKLAKAKSLGVEVLDEEAFLEKIGGGAK
jgi:DNA ligase (NAD+)